MIVSVIKRTHFNAAHRLHVKEWTDQENQDFFGLCNNPNFHGHNYDLEVKVTGESDPVSGYLIDLNTLKEIVSNEVLKPFDHRNLNLDVPEFKNLNPTAENIAFVIWNKIRSKLDTKYELTIKLFETPRNIVEYNGK